MDPPAELRGDGVGLRRPTADDAPAYAAAFRDDPELAVLLGYENDPDEAWVLDRIARAGERAGFELVITADGSDALRGMVAVHRVELDHGRAEVGFWLAPAARGKRLGARAVALLVDWLFTDAGLRRLELSTTPENGGALTLARRLGFTEEGVQRQRDVERGRPVDIVWFAMLREEWTKPTRR